MLNGIREFLRNILHQIQAVRIAPKNILEILVLAVLVYYLILWIKRSRAWVLLRGIVVLLIFVLLAKLFELNVISFIADRTLSILVIALLVLFQPELRAALEQIGQGKFIRYFLRSNRSQTEKMYPPEAVKEIAEQNGRADLPGAGDRAQARHQLRHPHRRRADQRAADQYL